jgi:formamidopyrimidine-DNA glycosylase
MHAPPKRPHDHVDIEFDSGVVLRYHDPRRFGAILWAHGSVQDHPLLASLGPEPLAANFDAGYLFRATRGRTTGIKQVLMDSQVVVGIGNIYANESLFKAGIRPTRGARRVSRARLERLVVAVRETLTEAIAKGGSTLRDYVDSNGQAGQFQLSYYVYGRDGEPCRICGSPIRSVRVAGRGTFYCPHCQA